MQLDKFQPLQSFLELSQLSFGPEGLSEMVLTLTNLLGRALVAVTALSTVLSLVKPASAESIFAVPAPLEILVAVPGPLVGAGLPGLAVLSGVYGAIWLPRKLRGRRRAE